MTHLTKIRKIIIPISLITIILVIFLAGSVQAYEGYPGFETVGSDNVLIDDIDDLYLSNSGFQESSEQIPSLDLLNATFSETGDNYTIVVYLNGEYSNKNASITIYAEINGTNTPGGFSSEYNLRTEYADLWISRIEGDGTYNFQVARLPGGATYQNIAKISGNMINMTFPKTHFTDSIQSVNSISEWKFVIISSGDSGGNTYYDILPNFGSGSNGIPGYSLLLVGLISTISLLISVKKIRKK
ncbi:MAG: hypothetical protein GF311_01095 [Candidatus Lokiarchaeota archaeon]|nr:hypothetical protein [Candidatus Lokiarchaeota archaeon]